MPQKQSRRSYSAVSVSPPSPEKGSKPVWKLVRTGFVSYSVYEKVPAFSEIVGVYGNQRGGNNQ